jgi:hypothetical protein
MLRSSCRQRVAKRCTRCAAVLVLRNPVVLHRGLRTDRWLTPPPPQVIRAYCAVLSACCTMPICTQGPDITRDMVFVSTKAGFTHPELLQGLIQVGEMVVRCRQCRPTCDATILQVSHTAIGKRYRLTRRRDYRARMSTIRSGTGLVPLPLPILPRTCCITCELLRIRMGLPLHSFTTEHMSIVTLAHWPVSAMSAPSLLPIAVGGAEHGRCGAGHAHPTPCIPAGIGGGQPAPFAPHLGRWVDGRVSERCHHTATGLGGPCLAL